ncbi:MAG TPA: UDP-N-acetylmuramoyl-tripeptide--D-alanyl-D-alanine ligase [Gemmatimonadaceae bacterium]|nr:UDP-N-acetylmuramoyl-tripeptide--D-alanyl-D-alanine ligase [Gemmatimonadaceae bacterium]
MSSGTAIPAAATGFWTLERVAAALAPFAGGNLPSGSTPLRAVCTDTRQIADGDLFIALSGERFDAHDFLGDAVDKGAAALVVVNLERAVGLGVPVYAVADTLVALGALARYYRRAWNGPLVAVAGSNGKTTTKDMIRAALARAFDVHATIANLNNLVGVPLTLLAMPPRTEIAVIELGTNVPGEVARLRAICEPNIAVVTSIGEEHLEGLGTLDAVLAEEASVFDGVAIGIVPGAQPEIADVARRLAGRVVVAGLVGGDLPVTGWGVDPEGRGWFEVDGVSVHPPVRGAHNLRNAALAVAVARECGVSNLHAAEGIAGMPLPSMRTAWESLGTATLINDAYNANPPSMRAALDLLSGVDGGRQRVAILGGMREMGAQAGRLHEEMARYALATRVEVIAGIGEMASALDSLGAADPRVVTATDVDELWPLIEPRLTPTSVILLKASRGVRLERLVPHLSDWAARTCSPG